MECSHLPYCDYLQENGSNSHNQNLMTCCNKFTNAVLSNTCSWYVLDSCSSLH